jgi:maleylacetate reductase
VTAAPAFSLAVVEPDATGGLKFAATLPSGQRVEFGRGARGRLPWLLDSVGAGDGPVGVVASRSQVAGLGELRKGVGNLRFFGDVRPHASAELCERALSALGDSRVIVAVGGGSALGIAKAVVSQLRVPFVAVPTTYAGSELTMLYGVTRDGRKRVVRDPHTLAAIVVYDPAPSDALPARAAGGSVMNCLAHCLECAWCSDGDERVAQAALEGCRAIGEGTRMACERATAAAGRDRLLLAGMWGGIALANGSTGVHHAVCHAVGGQTGASHGDINAIVLPAVVEAVADDVGDLSDQLVAPLRPVAAAAADAPPHAVVGALRDGWALPTRRREVGVGDADIPALVSQVREAADGAPWGAAWDERHLRALIGGLA